MSFLKLIPVLLFLSVSYPKFSNSTKYIAVPKYDDIFKICPGQEDAALRNFVDLSGMKINRIDDEVILLHGYIIATADGLVKTMLVDVERKVRGEWRPTVYSIVKNDLCQSFKSSKEIWYKFTKNFNPPCPLKKGQNLTFTDVDISLVMDLPVNNMQGDYRMQVLWKGEVEICCLLYFELIRM